MILAAAAIAGSAYLIFFKDRDDFLLPFALAMIVLVIAYVFQHQIDQLMTRGVPQQLDRAMYSMLMNTAPHFAAMQDRQKLMVSDRMKRWVLRKEFINKNEQDAPEDVKFILAFYAVLLTMHQEKFLYETLDRIVFYHHPFLTPFHPDDVHLVEIESTDGTIIISVPHLLKGHLEKGYYNLALHAMADAYSYEYIHHPIKWPDDIWEKLEEISSISRDKLEAYLGMKIMDPWPVAVHHQLMYRDASIAEVLSVFPQFGTPNELTIQ
jgi:hypothetical protein